jgi:histidine triad (HIT) family protein
MGCIFCQIAAGEIPAEILHKDKSVIAFRDISPQAPVHVLVIPVAHIDSLASLGDGEVDLVGHVFEVVNEIARREGIAATGYRVAVNSGQEGGQVVGHLHFHLLGGRQLSGQLG